MRGVTAAGRVKHRGAEHGMLEHANALLNVSD
jgi:hypothetical protein